jgi:hypothetical protein
VLAVTSRKIEMRSDATASDITRPGIVPHTAKGANFGPPTLARVSGPFLPSALNLNLNAVNLDRMKHEQCREQIVLRVAPTLREEIERAASDEGRSLANMTRRILEG